MTCFASRYISKPNVSANTFKKDLPMTFQDLIKLLYIDDIETLKTEKKSGVDFTITDSYNKANLLIYYVYCAKNLNYKPNEIIAFLLDCGININNKSNKRDGELSPIYMAVVHLETEILKELINQGADIESRDSSGCTPLFRVVMDYAGKEKENEIIEILIGAGASLDSKNIHDISPRDVIKTTGVGIDQGHNSTNWDLRRLLN
jgi:ankyrin repeat protein